ncbi:MAG: hypothetical protein LBC94_02040 [Desulfovibrio sp.]|nr:hypothetical protein [Desulfovibrio sp.]
MKKSLMAVLIVLLGFSLSACAWMGRTAGKAKAKIERKTDEIDHAYHQGYANEKSRAEKSNPAESSKKQQGKTDDDDAI